ncbi:homoserine kinase [Buchnera aphidicola]|uniref:Homoserine kinase n=1 Tax=Buchnera aphidicola (Therioaphis trifolii) TaxID=1241884 RepID=A0A4D6YDM0_9GAMM|nr:homoserine kinase [Buchnera aphidicola]QCI27142.1 homoserine kinase [Buchnera aphidicola (Therioaphis trifolii)]
MIKIYAPASIGNINVGFDLLGAAISPKNGKLLGDTVTIKSNNTFNLNNTGKFAFQLPKNIKKNIVWKCWNHFCKIIGKKILISITLEKNMPIGSGLGSSACSIVATLVAINKFCNKPLNSRQLLYLMGVIEGEISGDPHYDNVAPCYYGGLQLIINENNYISQSIPFFKDWIWIVAWPGIKISTSSARSILPLKYDKKICIEHSRLLAGFIHASYTQQSKLALKLMKDIIAEPYRMQLIPNYLKIKKQVLNLGAINFGISGSGPTIFVICNNEIIAKNISKWLSKNYLKNNQGFVHICELDTKGTRIIGE